MHTYAYRYQLYSYTLSHIQTHTYKHTYSQTYITINKYKHIHSLSLTLSLSLSLSYTHTHTHTHIPDLRYYSRRVCNKDSLIHANEHGCPRHSLREGKVDLVGLACVCVCVCLSMYISSYYVCVCVCSYHLYLTHCCTRYTLHTYITYYTPPNTHSCFTPVHKHIDNPHYTTHTLSYHHHRYTPGQHCIKQSSRRVSVPSRNETELCSKRVLYVATCIGSSRGAVLVLDLHLSVCSVV
jgi:hypothetical protein